MSERTKTVIDTFTLDAQKQTEPRGEREGERERES